jgi:hypothetical protein
VLLVVASLVVMAVSVGWTTWIEPPTEIANEALAHIARHIHDIDNGIQEMTERESHRAEEITLWYRTRSEDWSEDSSVRRANWWGACVSPYAAAEP